jgi:hypothetical protein
MIGFRDPPPSAGSPRRRRCSSTRRDRRRGFLRGNGADGLIRTSTSLFGRYPEQAKTELFTKIAKSGIAFTPFTAGRETSGQPNFVAGGCTVDPLQDELEIEDQLEFADHDDRRVVALQRHQIAASDFAFDEEAEPFEESLDRLIE